ncbi:hypothetical protein AMES_4078 [Amycolatopsis mediterranei S699]|uniref:Uncharacterized protein n=1 Tax=Amycolatopsis mediterranei (strain U-32) TaxID=749927 RepID=A0A0H3D751_AMYMU|nr:hypothetical protein [Amycolatopsis mediterranei]ADJ45903.1 hypothetical protein AMED_4126 [Amycolatopsis mediterranei U32]AFO77614.1 hypothetical protein AMES_4078 [Amycolatopsis mediterranei S699]AGT84742.1 hypothetical protein B737_4078 [Amycolatopsis mediterranei RB]UZF71166.1 hypothetical protein ISP_004418 [Amycolatopsis mediterranei]
MAGRSSGRDLFPTNPELLRDRPFAEYRVDHRPAGKRVFTASRVAGPPAGPGHEPDRGRPGGGAPEPAPGPVLAQVRGAAGAPPGGPAGRPGEPGGAG